MIIRGIVRVTEVEAATGDDLGTVKFGVAEYTRFPFS